MEKQSSPLKHVVLFVRLENPLQTTEAFDGPTYPIIVDYMTIERIVDEAHHPPYLSWLLVITNQLVGIMDDSMFAWI